MTLKETVLEYYGTKIDATFELTPSYTVQFHEIPTADGYSIYRRYTAGESGIMWDADVFYYPENMADDIKETIREGNHYLLIDEEILAAIGADDDEGYFWEELYEELSEEAQAKYEAS